MRCDGGRRLRWPCEYKRGLRRGRNGSRGHARLFRIHVALRACQPLAGGGVVFMFELQDFPGRLRLATKFIARMFGPAKAFHR